MRTLAYVAAVYGSTFVLYFIDPKFAGFLFTVAPLVFMGANMTMLAALFLRPEDEIPFSTLSICELVTYVLLLTGYGGCLSGRLLVTYAPADVPDGFPMLITVASVFVGFLAGTWPWIVHSLFPARSSDD
jgi:hypothetical protein